MFLLRNLWMRVTFSLLRLSSKSCLLETIDSLIVRISWEPLTTTLSKNPDCDLFTKQIVNLMNNSTFCMDISQRGYSWMVITSKTGAIIDGQKVDRETFFTLNVANNLTKSLLSFTTLFCLRVSMSRDLKNVLFMRNMDYIGISQSIGRVIRLGDSQKTFGLICVPVYDKVGISTSRSVQAVVDTVFHRGEPAVSVVRR